MTPQSRQVRDFALILAVFLIAWAARRYFRYGVTAGVAAAALAAVVVAVLGVLRPGAVRPLFRAAMAVTAPIGFVMNRVVLGLLFFGLFAPVGWLFRRLRRDPLHLAKPDVPSHWTPVPPSSASSYLRQSQ